ncbi:MULTISPECIES: DUF3040 domain-containing protein [unclassified Streptomyces]|uniref:DUF3040 domain-containing protein n=1 Tax=unclassified Streptomyces TaxID=2593676 RepID=UPI003625CE5F
MSHPADDQRILAEIEHDLSRDDPALMALVDALNKQFPGQPTPPGEVRAPRHRARLVVAVALVVIALVGLVLIAVLGGGPSTPPDVNDGVPTTW